ncbi:MAG: hypothetical protein QM755_23315 [Luteolibacter sp.]
MKRSLVAAVCGFLFAHPLFADSLDEYFAQVRGGEKVALERPDALATLNQALGEAKGSAEMYLAQIKASIVAPKFHGGWPYRSSLLYHDTKAVYDGIKDAYSKNNDAIYLYATICPALALGKKQEADELREQLKTKDPFLSRLVEANFELWKKSIPPLVEGRKKELEKMEKDKKAAEEKAKEGSKE